MTNYEKKRPERLKEHLKRGKIYASVSPLSAVYMGAMKMQLVLYRQMPDRTVKQFTYVFYAAMPPPTPNAALLELVTQIQGTGSGVNYAQWTHYKDDGSTRASYEGLRSVMFRLYNFLGKELDERIVWDSADFWYQQDN